MLRLIASIITGFLFINIAIMLLFFLYVGSAFFTLSYEEMAEIKPSMAFMVGGIIYGLFVAFAAGYLTTMIAGYGRWTHTYILIGIFLILSVVNMVTASGNEPLWCQIANIFMMTGGLYGGTWVYNRAKSEHAAG